MGEENSKEKIQTKYVLIKFFVLKERPGDNQQWSWGAVSTCLGSSFYISGLDFAVINVT